MKKLIVSVLLVAVLVGLFFLRECNGMVTEASPPATATPTETAFPSSTPTSTPTPTVTPPPTVTATLTPIPSVWEIAERMLAECFPVDVRPTWTPGSPEMDAVNELSDLALRRHPELADWSAVGDTSVLIDNGGPPSPFAIYDYQGSPRYPPESYYDSGIFEGRQCDLFLLFFEDLPENHDGDGILVGEAYLFYEIGKTGPYKLGGELREVHFIFPPIP